jgi:hypothetical protein
MLAQRVGLLTPPIVDGLLTISDEIGRMLSGLRNSLESKIDNANG